MTDAAVNVVKGVAGLPAELVAQLNSDDPQVRGMALVSALTLGSVATAVTVKLGLGAAGKFIPSIKLGTVGAGTGVRGEAAVSAQGIRTGDYEGKAVLPDETTFQYSAQTLSPKTGGSLTGPIEQPATNASVEQIRSLTRQEEAAQILSKDYGMNIERLPNDQGASKLSQPDWKINGEVADVYSPKSGNVQTVWDNISAKTNPSDQQAANVVLNLADSPLSATDVAQYIQRNPVPGLKSLTIMKNGVVSVLEP
jgi:filamentous hemagglutinin